MSREWQQLLARLTAILLWGVLLAPSLTSCRALDEFLATSAPALAPERVRATPVPPDESPRLRNAQEIPPTWTPVPEDRSESPVSPISPRGTAQSGAEPGTYIVQPGDTLAEIASRFNISMDVLAEANGIEDFDHIEVGQVLVIPAF